MYTLKQLLIAIAAMSAPVGARPACKNKGGTPSPIPDVSPNDGAGYVPGVTITSNYAPTITPLPSSVASSSAEAVVPSAETTPTSVYAPGTTLQPISSPSSSAAASSNGGLSDIPEVTVTSNYGPSTTLVPSRAASSSTKASTPAEDSTITMTYRPTATVQYSNTVVPVATVTLNQGKVYTISTTIAYAAEPSA